MANVIPDPRQTDLEEFTNPTVVNVVSYFTCERCDYNWYVQEPQVRWFMACDRCGAKTETCDQEEVDG